jgi:hypothetical protein
MQGGHIGKETESGRSTDALMAPERSVGEFKR